ncbi:hypothetical protein LWP59_30760 [Amycolatopsis acidiphila]|uniref:hypothetical protein n=1 Tax=Amycolatopsis acidiphila TaxID=715473 RepID=UPI001643D701|nr:hypothetical protein [Amycolatopsis acidiphila]UIJ58459.1 hypothetical protein LWP59_30760 [Amycolatopsis acidiphila]GHG77411.1 hypothetical protein GCM10017788_43730 [Amycolatopsis acidiphila]
MNAATEPETLAELISDCADIPAGLRERRPSAPTPPAPRGWAVDEACHSQVADLDDYA